MKQLPSNNSDFILYTSPDGEVRVDVFVNDETVWLTQKAMQDFSESTELEENLVSAKIAHTVILDKN